VRSKTPDELEGPSRPSEMTEMTGGRVFPVGNIGELPDIAANLGMELRNQYVLDSKKTTRNPNVHGEKSRSSCGHPRGYLLSMFMPRPATTPRTSSSGRLAVFLIAFLLVITGALF